MADQEPHSDSRRPDRLLIKVILPNQGASKRVQPGGQERDPFRPVDSEFRKSLSTRVLALRQAIEPATRRIGASPARVRLIPKAFAKSHRPEQVLSDKTCPIIGAGKLGELFIRATPTGLANLDRIIRTGDSAVIKRQLSAIETIEPITPNDRRGGRSAQDLLRHAPKTKAGYVTKVQLFDIRRNQSLLERDFHDTCNSIGIQVQQKGYTTASQFFEAVCRKAEDLEKLSRIVGVRSIREMPVLRTIRTSGTSRRPLPSDLPLPEVPLNQYPVVGVVDSGVRDDVPELNEWVIGRESVVAPEYRNTAHGTFVGGLIAFGKMLNPGLEGIDESPCAILDLQVIPNGDPDAGEVDELTEAQLLQDLEQVLRQHANEVKVWNLSLGTDEVCSLDAFSSFAVELDRLQETYGVSFVISAGNYRERPHLNYPRTASQLDKGRITTPADSVLGITVGSISHFDLPKTGPHQGELSPFSRHGAGPNFIIKPDLTHYGGTCRPDGGQLAGVESIVDADAVGDGCGTSYSTPLVSRLLANVYHQITPSPSRELARAILTHHARDARSGKRVPDNEENFLGFGLPSPTPGCLECSPWMSTLVFEDTLRPGYFLEWDHFPYPRSLTRNGRFFGDIWMTVAFAPARGASWGSEYCETHIDAHFGVYRTQRSRNGKVSEKFRGLVPPEHKNKGELYEYFQVEQLRKWAPVRTYFGSLGEKGERGSRWRLMLRLLSRHDADAPEVRKPQPFALMVSISDPLKRELVYDEMATAIRTRFSSTNLALRAAARVRAAV